MRHSKIPADGRERWIVDWIAKSDGELRGYIFDNAADAHRYQQEAPDVRTNLYRAIAVDAQLKERLNEHGDW